MSEEQAVYYVEKIMSAIEKFAYVGDGEDRDDLLNALYGLVFDIAKGLKDER